MTGQQPASRFPLREAATICGLVGLMKKYLPELKRLCSKYKGPALTDLCYQVGAGGTCEFSQAALSLANLLCNPRVVHCQLPGQWATPSLVYAGALACVELGEDWAYCLRVIKSSPHFIVQGWGQRRVAQLGEERGDLARRVLEKTRRLVGAAKDRSAYENQNRFDSSGSIHTTGKESPLPPGLVSAIEKYVSNTTGERSKRSRRNRGLWAQVDDKVRALSLWLQSQTAMCYPGIRRFELTEIRKVVNDCLTRYLCGAYGDAALGPECRGRLPGQVRPSSAGLGGKQAWSAGGDPRVGRGGLAWCVGLDPAVLDTAVSSIQPEEVYQLLLERDVSIGLRGLLQQQFPRKAHPQAGKKANIFLDCLLADYDREFPELTFSLLCLLYSLPPGVLYEDQVCSAILFGAAYCPGPEALGITAAILAELAAGCKRFQALSDCIKASGSNCRFEWAKLAELNCLKGRATGDLDLRADAVRRTGPKVDMEVEVDRQALIDAIDSIYSEELGAEPIKVLPASTHWDRRFEWCVAGSHPHVINARGAFLEVPSKGPGGRRMTRRMAMEYTKANALDLWDGKVRVSVIPKLEQGKTRAIYSCDTTSYAAFSRILRPAEKRWAGRRVIVDPGAGGNYGMFRRIRKAWSKALPTAVMLDYADFNSQHTIESQQLVIERLLARCVGVEPEEAQKLIDSLANMEVYLEGERLGRVTRSLMSGHRGTSFINSVLNAAYIRVVLGSQAYDRLQAFHVGDDVLVFCRSWSEGYDLLDSMSRAGFHLQSKKQSIGRQGFEFLRMAGNRYSAHGYLARSVASTVSGNWTTDLKDDPLAVLLMFVQQARSLINRSGSPTVYRLLASSARVFTSLQLPVLLEVLSGRVAVGNGPVFRTDGRYEHRECLEVSEELPDYDSSQVFRNLPKHATRDYFSRGRADIERVAMDLVGRKPWEAALRSSYGDLARDPALVAAAEEHGSSLTRRVVSLSAKTFYLKRGEVLLEDELDKKIQRGILIQYPIIALLQHHLSDKQINYLLTRLGVYASVEESRAIAFGACRVGAVVRGWLPYSDAASLGARGVASTVRVLYPLRM
ncbi:RNA-dependent RNA polymerase [Eimeriavirus sani]|uniref:RNA-directed RNA polymerase n=1 Tax=Eimeria stiedai RNA virus 1 TaxID=1898175 RepID=A0A6G7PS32_9VIRU|nr:RNA-dependent RNA polymerase [Eimeria stiedai RNA virus 1]